MLLCLGLIAVLLYDTVFGSATTCVHTYESAPGRIEAHSRRLAHLDRPRCEYVLRAPTDSTIVVNVTLLHGFERSEIMATSASPGQLPAAPASPTPSASPCLPSLQIAEVGRDGSAAVMRTICPPSPSHHAILVFRSRTAQLRVTYVWLTHRPSAFALHFDFVQLHKEDGNGQEKVNAGPCEFTCSTRGCLSSWSLVCNGVSDCPDHSDEFDCPLPLPSSGSPSSHSNASRDDVFSIQIIIIVIAVVLTLSVITCVVSHYKMGARSWSERRTARGEETPRETHQQHTNQRQRPCQTANHRPDLLHNTSTLLYVPTASQQERLHREKVSLQDRQVRNKSVQLDLELDLPPSIALPDGEEQPYGSLQHLHLRDPEQESEIYRECIRPPPNRIVFEGDSPPPYRSSSVGFLPHTATVSGSGGSGCTPPLRIARDWNGAPLVMRCHSLSANNNGSQQQQQRNSNGSNATQYVVVPPTNLVLLPPISRHQSPPTPADRSPPPPGYNEVIANPSVYSQPPSNGV